MFSYIIIDKTLTDSKKIIKPIPKRPNPITSLNQLIFNTDKILGKGAYGTVVSVYAINLKLNVAVKEFKNNKEATKTYIAERGWYETLRGSNYILKYFGHIDSVASNVPNRLIVELMPKKTFQHFIVKHDLNWGKDARLLTKLFLNAAQGLAFIHQNQLIYSDFKLENILITQINSEYVAKLSDFGLTQKVGDNIPRGTPNYLASEVLDLKEITQASDVFSFGMSLYKSFVIKNFKNDEFFKEPEPKPQTLKEILSTLKKKRTDHFEKKMDEALKKLQVPTEILELCKKCLLNDPAKRPKIHEVINTLTIFNKNYKSWKKYINAYRFIHLLSKFKENKENRVSAVNIPPKLNTFKL